MTSRSESAPEFVPNAAEGLIPNVIADDDGGGGVLYSPSPYPYYPYLKHDMRAPAAHVLAHYYNIVTRHSWCGRWRGWGKYSL
jgi:hypothetical protein